MSKSKYQMVREFHQAFSYPMASTPTPMDSETVMNRLGFLAEEMIEVLHATAQDNTTFHELYCELLDRMDKSYIRQVEKEYPTDILTAQVDGFLDIEYFNNGNFTIINIDPDKPFKIVHDANMGKLFPDGKPRYNDNGKIIKPDNWEEEYAPEPLLKAEIQRQIEASQQ